MEKEKVLMLTCSKCGKSNLVSEKRLKHMDKEPLRCWYCKSVLEMEDGINKEHKATSNG